MFAHVTGLTNDGKKHCHLEKKHQRPKEIKGIIKMNEGMVKSDPKTGAKGRLNPKSIVIATYLIIIAQCS